jgi:UDP-glucose 6-dehydrogenase
MKIYTHKFILYWDILQHVKNPNAEFTICTCFESESMKIFCNNFYAKVQFFKELFMLTQSNGSQL